MSLTRVYFFISFFLVLVSCKKEIVVFDSEVDESLNMSYLIKLNGKPCFFDNEFNELRYSIHPDSLTSFSPFIEFKENIDLTINGKQIKNSKVNALGAIELNKGYTVKFNIEGKEHHFNLFFTNLPTVQLVSLDKIKNGPKNFAKIIVNDPFLNNIQESYIKISVRGTSSKFERKKSYGFNPIQNIGDQINRPFSFFNFEESSKWVLNSMHRDKSKIRNKVSLELWSKIHPNSTINKIQTKLIELFFNNESLGLYNFHQNYSEEFLNINSSSSLIRGAEISEYSRFEEYDYSTPTIYWAGYEQVFPDPKIKIEWSDFQKFSDIVANSTDETFRSQIDKHIDVENVMDFLIFIQLISGRDNIATNCFFFKEYPNDLFAMLPWDMDVSFGRAIGSEYNGGELILNHLYFRLIVANPNSFKDDFKQKWNLLRTTTLTNDSIFSVIDRDVIEIQKSGIENIENRKWDIDFNIASEQQFMENFLNQHLADMDVIINAL